eukprot:gene7934-10733_t
MAASSGLPPAEIFKPKPARAAPASTLGIQGWIRQNMFSSIPSAVVTLLGLIPGATGITKMTRLLGLMGAQPFILESKLFNPREALELGLVHELVPANGDDVAASLRTAALLWIAANPKAQHPWDAKDYKIPGGTPANPKIAGMLTVAPAVLKQKTRGLYPAPEAALAAMAEGAMVDYDTATRIES